MNTEVLGSFQRVDQKLYEWFFSQEIFENKWSFERKESKVNKVLCGVFTVLRALGILAGV